jgi:perosamine synthetase
MAKIIQIEPWIDEEEAIQLARVVASTYVVEHELTKEFEQSIIDLTGSKHAVAVTNGSMALFCALRSLGIGPGDEVIVPNLTFVASANSIILAGAKPVFCDVDPKTYCIDIDSMKQVVTNNTKAVMPVHLYGQSADLVNLLEAANELKIKVIEDAAQGVGVTFNGKHVGTFGEIGILSFYGNKTITCGEGGVILTNSDELAAACYRLKNHGRDVKGTFVHDHIGFNFAFTEMQAAIGIAQMNKLSRIIGKKRNIHDRYVEELADIELMQPQYIDKRCSPVFWFTSFLCSRRNELATYLEGKGIQTRRFFYPLHLQPCYEGVISQEFRFENSTKIYDEGISLPSSYNLSDVDQSTVIASIRRFFLENRG